MLIVMPFSSADYRQGLDRFSGFTIASCLQRPRSCGTLRVRSASRADAPLIQPNFLDHESDRQAMIDGLRLARRIAATDPLRNEIEREERPGSGVASDQELLDYIRATATSVYHPAGTCRMGNGPDAIVDAKLRVRGLDGLVVADASIMPTLVSSSPNATAIMIGERAAALLLGEG